MEQNKNLLGKEKLIKCQLEGKLHKPTLEKKRTRSRASNLDNSFLKTELPLKHFFLAHPSFLLSLFSLLHTHSKSEVEVLGSPLWGPVHIATWSSLQHGSIFLRTKLQKETFWSCQSLKA